MDRAFNFQLSQPSGPLSDCVQGLWTASVAPSAVVKKTLVSDACSGIVFNLRGGFKIDQEVTPIGVVMLPVEQEAKTVELAGGAQLAGVRFHPAFGFGLLGRRYAKPSLLSANNDDPLRLHDLYDALVKRANEGERLDLLSDWAQCRLKLANAVPFALQNALRCIDQAQNVSALDQNSLLSQRQIERLFKQWLGMTPKRYQRLVRVSRVAAFMRQHKAQVDLAQIAMEFGFSDQAHMTREFRLLAHSTPGTLA